MSSLAPGAPVTHLLYLHGFRSSPRSALADRGDEVLSWREMSGRYAGSPTRLIDGSDHALSDFDNWLPEVTAFLGL